MFLSKQRIESIWYHESESFSIKAYDAVSSGETYTKASLYCYLSSSNNVYTNQYSVDIGSSESERIQLELYTDTPSHLPPELRCLKLYGNYLLIGGSNGFIAVSYISKNQKCIDKFNAQALFCVPHQTWAPVFDSDSHPAAGGMSPGSFKNLNSNPHRPDSNITCITSIEAMNVFVVADDQRTISVWELMKNNNITSIIRDATSEEVAVSPMLKCSVNLADTDPSGINRTEVITKLQIIMSGLFLLVSTNKRLLLFHFDSNLQLPDLNLNTSSDSHEFEEETDKEVILNTNSNENLSVDNKSNLPYISGWVELDRVLPGCDGIFAMHVAEKFFPVSANSKMAEIRRKFIQWKITSEFSTEELKSKFILSAVY